MKTMFENNLKSSQEPLFPPMPGLLLLMGMVMIGIFVGNLLGIALLMPFGFAFEDFVNLAQNPANYPNGRMALLTVQAITALVGFILMPILYIRFVHQQNLQQLSPNKVQKMPIVLLATVVVTIAFMPLNAVFIRLNEAMQLPDFLKNVEVWMRTQEETLGQLTKFLVQFDGSLELIFGIFVIAILPGVGEELLFRGVIQPLFLRQFKNIHIAIWLTAALFSLFHFQFYGFLPRMLLGAAFGYLYMWSGNLLVPIVAHFTNNAFTVLMFVLYNKKIISIDIDSAQDMPIVATLFSVVVSGWLFWKIRELCLPDADRE